VVRDRPGLTTARGPLALPPYGLGEGMGWDMAGTDSGMLALVTAKVEAVSA
jgi:hypothetical protein